MGGSKRGNFGNTYGASLDALSNFLTAVSLIPGVDTIADFLAIPVDLARGDFTSAGLDALGVIPVLGEIADTAKIAKVADKAVDVAKIVDKTTDRGKSLKKIKNINKQKRGTPRNNKAQNRQTNDIGKRLKLTPKQQRELHDAIHGLNMGYQEILDFAKDWFGKK